MSEAFRVIRCALKEADSKACIFSDGCTELGNTLPKLPEKRSTLQELELYHQILLALKRHYEGCHSKKEGETDGDSTIDEYTWKLKVVSSLIQKRREEERAEEERSKQREQQRVREDLKKQREQREQQRREWFGSSSYALW